MSKNTITVLIYHRHKLLGLIFISCVYWQSISLPPQEDVHIEQSKVADMSVMKSQPNHATSLQQNALPLLYQ
jgi:hypothetical protein